MKRRPLGNTDLEVSVLGLGTVKLGRNTGVRYPQPFRIPEDDQVRALLGTALDLGINLVDTAPAYGNSEARLGRLLPGRRRDWVIATKVGETFTGGRSRHDFSPTAIRTSMERSLRRLRTDYLDVVLLHSAGSDRSLLEDDAVVQTLLQARAAGMVRAVGISAKTHAGALLGARLLDLAMLEPRLLPTTPVCHRVLVKKAFDSGHAVSQEARSQRLASLLDSQAVASVVIGTIDTDHLRANADLVETISAAFD